MDVTVPHRFRGAALSDFEREAVLPAFELIELINDTPADVPERYHAAGQGWVETGRQVRNFRGLDGLVIVGPTGVGKTHLLAALANALDDAERLFRSTLTIVDEAKDDVGGRGTRFPYHTYPAILMLDDLSGVRPTDFAIDTITRIIRVRYDESLPTIVTMHSSRNAISELYGAAIASRILELGPIIKLDGPDLRGRAR